MYINVLLFFVLENAYDIRTETDPYLFCKVLMGSLFIMTNSLDVPHKMAIIWPDTFG